MGKKINPEDVLNIEMAISAYNYKKSNDTPKMTKGKLAQQLWPDSSPTAASTKLSFIINGQLGETRPLTPSQVRTMCKVLECDFNFIYNTPH